MPLTMSGKKIVLLAIFGFYYLVLIHQVKGEEGIVGEASPAIRHTIKTIKNAYGDIFDCVEVDKQPAFDHPLLKNHTIQMRPTVLPKSIGNASIGYAKTYTDVSSTIGQMGEKCPNGSVPVMRLPNKSMSNFRAEDIFNQQEGVDCRTTAEIKMKRREYYGSTLDINVYGFPGITRNQVSGSTVWVMNDGGANGTRERVNAILAGWIVHPSLFGDTQTRFFTYWTSDGYQNKGCFNLLCPGFVQVNPNLPLGGIISPVSVYNGTQYVISLTIFKDPHNQHWWLVLGRDQAQIVGYWPNSIITTLTDHANKVKWGGLAYASNGEKSPPMGNGHYPEEFYDLACFFDRVWLVSLGATYEPIAEQDMMARSSGCYHVGYCEQRENGRHFDFGGPGGCC